MNWLLPIRFIFLFSISLFATPFEEDLTFQFRGNHFIASYIDCDKDALIDLIGLERAILTAAKKSGAGVLDYLSHTFPKNGFTMIVLLSESHASIHTYPEYNACFVDLFTCGEHCAYEEFDDYLRNYLKPKKSNHKVLSRCYEIKEKL